MKRLLFSLAAGGVFVCSQVVLADDFADDKAYLVYVEKELSDGCMKDVDFSEDACKCLVGNLLSKLSVKELKVLEKGQAAASPEESKVINTKLAEIMLSCDVIK